MSDSHGFQCVMSRSMGRCIYLLTQYGPFVRKHPDNALLSLRLGIVVNISCG